MTTEDALKWIADLFEEPAGRIALDTTRDEIAAWDSLGTLTLMAGLDEQFDIQLTADQIATLKTVRDLVELLQREAKA